MASSVVQVHSTLDALSIFTRTHRLTVKAVSSLITSHQQNLFFFRKIICFLHVLTVTEQINIFCLMRALKADVKHFKKEPLDRSKTVYLCVLLGLRVNQRVVLVLSDRHEAALRRSDRQHVSDEDHQWDKAIRDLQLGCSESCQG